MYSYITPLLKKKLDHILLHVGTNDAVLSPPEKIHQNLINLSKFINSTLSETNILLSTPITSSDNGRANLTVINLADLLKKSGTTVMNNSNINHDCLGKKGLHLSRKGTGKLAMNTINLIKKL